MMSVKRGAASIPSLARAAGLALLMTFAISPFSSAIEAGAIDPAAPVRIVAFGDSLTAGYMLKPSEAFPAQLQVALAAKGYKVEIANAGVSGDTTAGGAERIAWTLQQPADAIIVELGANDALRGIAPSIAYANLEKILKAADDKGLAVLVAGMRAPGNWGPEYAAEFEAMYPELSGRFKTLLYPFFLEGVALDPKFVMDDGLHPTAPGVAEIVKRILPDVEALVKLAKDRRPTAPN